MTLQEVFNKAYLGLAGQGFWKSSVAGICFYRGPDGKKCAVGHLIDDKHYNPGIEHKAVYQPAVLDALRASGVETSSIDSVMLSLLNSMQMAHDETNEDFVSLKEKLAKVAAEFNLTVPELP